MTKIDHSYTSETVCPNCGQEHGDSWELSDSGEIDCDCGVTFLYERHVQVDYSTYFKEEECEHRDSHTFDNDLFSCDDCGKLERGFKK